MGWPMPGQQRGHSLDSCIFSGIEGLISWTGHKLGRTGVTGAVKQLWVFGGYRTGPKICQGQEVCWHILKKCSWGDFLRSDWQVKGIFTFLIVLEPRLSSRGVTPMVMTVSWIYLPIWMRPHCRGLLQSSPCVTDAPVPRKQMVSLWKCPNYYFLNLG